MNLRDFFCCDLWYIFKVSFFLLRTLCRHLGFILCGFIIDQNQHGKITKYRKKMLLFNRSLGFLFSCLFLTNTSFIFIFVTMKLYLICLVWGNIRWNYFLKHFNDVFKDLRQTSVNLLKTCTYFNAVLVRIQIFKSSPFKSSVDLHLFPLKIIK